MKKLFTLLLVLTCYVGTASAWGDAVLHGNFNGDNYWNADTQHFTKIDGNQFYFQLDGSVINDADFYFRFAVKGEGGSDSFVEKEPDTDGHKSDQKVTSTKVTSNYNSWSGEGHTTKAWYIEKDPKADKVEIYLKYANQGNDTWKWQITAVPLYKRTITWDNSSVNWANVKAYTFDEGLNDHRNIYELGTWGNEQVLTGSDNKYTVSFYGTSTVKALFKTGNGGEKGKEQTYDLEVVNNGIYNSREWNKTAPYAISASISSVGYATFSSTKAVDFSTLTSQVKAQKASVADGKISYTDVTSVAANEGVLLKSVSGEAETLAIPLHANQSVAKNGGNAFEAIDATLKLAQSTEDGYTNFILAKPEDGDLGFYKVNNAGSWCAAGTAYLKVNNSDLSAREFFLFTEEETTGINAVQNNNNANRVIYNLAGQKVDSNYKGVVIVNGKKMFNK